MVSCCDRAQQPRAPMILYVTVAVGGPVGEGVASGASVSTAEEDVGVGGGASTFADATDAAAE
eukprot:2120699-Pyramimonas_sp.AAC.1